MFLFYFFLSNPHSIPSPLFFFFNDTATPEIYPLPLHAALPIYVLPFDRLADDLVLGRPLRLRLAGRVERIAVLLVPVELHVEVAPADQLGKAQPKRPSEDRKSTRLNSSHDQISYAVFCLKKKKN